MRKPDYMQGCSGSQIRKKEREWIRERNIKYCEKVKKKNKRTVGEKKERIDASIFLSNEHRTKNCYKDV